MTDLQEIQNQYNVCVAESKAKAEVFFPKYQTAVLKVIAECSTIPAKEYSYEAKCSDMISTSTNSHSGGSGYYSVATGVNYEDAVQIIAEHKKQGKCNWDSSIHLISGHPSGEDRMSSVLKGVNEGLLPLLSNDSMEDMYWSRSIPEFKSYNAAILNLTKSLSDIYNGVACQNEFDHSIANYIADLLMSGQNEVQVEGL